MIGPLQIEMSRWKTLSLLAGSVAFVVMGVWLLGEKNPKYVFAAQRTLASWGSIIFGGASSVLMLWLLVRPRRMLLNSEGFRIVGLFYGGQRRLRWNELEGFVVLNSVGRFFGRRIKIPAYALAPGVDQRGLLRFWKSPVSLGGSWPGNVDALVAQLNAYREQALAEDAKTKAG